MSLASLTKDGTCEKIGKKIALSGVLVCLWKSRSWFMWACGTLAG